MLKVISSENVEFTENSHVTNRPNILSHNVVGIRIVANFREVASHCCCLSSSINSTVAPGTAKVSYCYLCLVFDEAPPTDQLQADGY